MNKLRHHKSYYAFLGHRLSGLALVIFLPLHFLTLGLALERSGALDAALAFTDLSIVKFAEWGLVILLALHFFFGLRVLMIEGRRWPSATDPYLSWVVPGAVAAAFVGGVFILQATIW